MRSIPFPFTKGEEMVSGALGFGFGISMLNAGTLSCRLRALLSMILLSNGCGISAKGCFFGVKFGLKFGFRGSADRDIISANQIEWISFTCETDR
jgi:hypothetical protein